MASRGSYLKQEITKKILEYFPGSFLYNDGKEIRINGKENGENLQIKVTLTCSKTVVGAAAEEQDSIKSNPQENLTTTQVLTEPSDEEKKRLQILLNSLNI